MTSIKKICVFCGSSPGIDPIYTQVVTELGKEMVKRSFDLVYGGGNLGLMGAIAQSVIENGGSAIGVIPQAIASKTEHLENIETVVTDSMHERKSKMFELSDAFIALPGGFGTLEEILEIITWAQLGDHEKPMGFLNIKGFYDGLFRFFEYSVAQQFVKEPHVNMIVNEYNPSDLLDSLSSFQNPQIGKWQK